MSDFVRLSVCMYFYYIRYFANLEHLAVIRAVEHFVPYLYGKEFTIVTDHAPLVWLMSAKRLNRHFHRFMLKLLAGVLLPTDGMSRQVWDESDEYSVMFLVMISPLRAVGLSRGRGRGGGGGGTPTQRRLTAD